MGTAGSVQQVESFVPGTDGYRLSEVEPIKSALVNRGLFSCSALFDYLRRRRQRREASEDRRG